MAQLRKKNPIITVQVGDDLPTIFVDYEDGWQSLKTETKIVQGEHFIRRVHEIRIEGQWRKDERKDV